MAKKITHDDFIKSIKQVHGNSYDYRKTTYVNRRTKVILTCFLHGDFEKTPTELAQGSGCQKCSRHARSLLAEKLSTETLKTRKKSFLEKAKAVHANKYDYSKVRYTNSASKVTVICPAHGEFRQAANSHLQGRGCKQCYLEDLGKDKMLPHREVINRLHKNHGEKYNYSKVNYTGISKPITLVCSKHGDFEILASQAFLGSGCQQCSIEARRKSNKDFVDEITAIFGAKYDFSEVNYFNTETRVKVICKNHGSWLSYPSSLLQGHGCRSCGDEKRALGRTKSTSDFIKEAVALHGNKYNYQRSKYMKNDVHVEIICSIHGAFHQSPHSHLKGSGCLQCGFESTHSSLKISKDEFIQRAAEVHGNRYDYNNIEYEGLKALVTLTCKIHGKFNLYPRAHLNGQYCTKCRVEERHNRFIKEAKNRHNNNFD